MRALPSKAADQGAAHELWLGGGGSKGSRRKSGAVPATVKPSPSAKSGTCLGPSSVSSAGTSRGAWASLQSCGASLRDDRFVNGENPCPHCPSTPIKSSSPLRVRPRKRRKHLRA